MHSHRNSVVFAVPGLSSGSSQTKQSGGGSTAGGGNAVSTWDGSLQSLLTSLIDYVDVEERQKREGTGDDSRQSQGEEQEAPIGITQIRCSRLE